MSSTANRPRAPWRPLIAIALVLGLVLPSWTATRAGAQEALPVTAAAAPETTVYFQTLNLDFEGAQWQQTGELLSRVGIPDALDDWRAEMLDEGAASGEFSEADLNALIGGEIALVVTEPAIERFAQMHQRHMRGDLDQAAQAMATPGAMAPDEPFGVAVVLAPGDPDAAWSYAERQVNALADQHGVAVQTSQEAGAEIIWTEGMSRAERRSMMEEDPFGMMFGHHGRGKFAAGRAGDFVIAAKSPADVRNIATVVDGTVPSLADSTGAQQIASRLPAESLSFVYVDLETAFASLDPSLIESISSLMPAGMPRESWGGQVGLAVSADQPGFRFDSIATWPEGADLSAILVENDPAIAAAAERVPEGTFIFEAGILPPNALAGLPYTFSQAVNGTIGEEAEGPMAMLPTPEEMEAEIAQATQTLGFDPGADLFDLLSGEFIAFATFPQFSASGVSLDAVASISTTDPAKLAETMSKMVDWVEKTAPEASIAERQAEGDTIFSLTDSDTEGMPAIEFGVVGDQAVVAIGNGLDELQSGPARSLADDAQFQEVMASLPSEYYQVIYFDTARAIATIMMFSGESMGGAEATPGVVQGSPENILAFGMVGFRQDDAAGSSAILYIAEP